MGITTHLEICEYVLLTKHPDGLKKNEIVQELLSRGWKDEVCKDVTIGPEDLKDLDELGEGFYRNVRKERDRMSADLSWVAHNVSYFCHRHQTETASLQKYRKEGDKEAVRFIEGDGYHGNVFFNLDGEEKFNFYPGSSGTPVAWTRNLSLLNVAAELCDVEMRKRNRSKEELGSQWNMDASIAKWFCGKFNMPFYDICMGVYYHRKKTERGRPVVPPNPDLKEFGMLEDVELFKH